MARLKVYNATTAAWEYVGGINPLTLALDSTFVGALPVFGRRNLLDNGAMQVSQRGVTSAVGYGASVFLIDRWYHQLGSLGAYTTTQTADGPAGTGFTKCIKLTASTAGVVDAPGDYSLLSQNIEGQNVQHLMWGTASAKAVTLSFWVKSNLTGTYIAEVWRGETIVRTISATYTISVANTWEYKTIVFPGDTTTVITNDASPRAGLNFWLGAGTTFGSTALYTTWTSAPTTGRATGQVNLAGTINNFIQFTGVQLEVGSVATPFEVRPYDEELRKCQRYFVRLDSTVNVYTPFGMGQVSAATTASCFAVLPVPMRVVPTTVLFSAANTFAFWGANGTIVPLTVISTTLGNSSNRVIRLDGTVAAGLISGNATNLWSNNTTAATINISAEI